MMHEIGRDGLREAWLHYRRAHGDRRPYGDILAEFDAWARDLDLRELHHFETEEENARLRAGLDS